MAIIAGNTILASDFISTSAGSGDSGKVPKLDAAGVLDGSFVKTPQFGAYTTLAASTNAPYDGFLVGYFVAATTGSTTENGSSIIAVGGVTRASYTWRKVSGTNGDVQDSSFCIPIAAGSQYTETSTKVTVNIAYIPLIRSTT